MAIVMRPRIRRSTSKMLNRKVELDGYLFDSIKESERYGELRLQLKAGLIHDLKIHPAFEFVVNGTHICRYEPDFSYLEFGKGKQEADLVIEDVKSEPVKRKRKHFSTKTAAYQIKKKLMLAIYGVEVREI